MFCDRGCRAHDRGCECVRRAGGGITAARLGPPVLATCALMAAGTRPNVVSFLLGRRPLAAIGDLSYSLYLWHWPLIVFGQALEPSAR